MILTRTFKFFTLMLLISTQGMGQNNITLKDINKFFQTNKEIPQDNLLKFNLTNKGYSQKADKDYSRILNTASEIKRDLAETPLNDNAMELLSKFQLLDVTNKENVTELMTNITDLSLKVYDNPLVETETKNNLSTKVEKLKSDLRLVRSNSLTHDKVLSEIYFETLEKINHNQKEKSISMISKSQDVVKSQKSSTKRMDAKNVENNIFSKLFLAMVLVIGSIALWYHKRQIGKKNEMISYLENIDHTQELVEKKYELQLEGIQKIKGLNVVVINSNGKVESISGDLRKVFAGAEGQRWDEIFTSKFKKEESIKNVNNLYKLVDDVKNDWLVESSLDKETKKRYCWLKKIESRVLTQISKSRTEVLESSKFHVGEYLENLIAQKTAYWNREVVKVNEAVYASDLYIYANEDEAKKVVSAIVNVASLLSRFKFEANATLDIRRVKKLILFKVYVQDLQMMTSDFSKIVRWNGVKMSVGEVLKSVEASSKDLGISTVVKNINKNEEHGLSFEITINDNESLKWLTRKYKVETTC